VNKEKKKPAAVDEEGPITDLTRGVYRKIYAGFIAGKRINQVSLEAEAWFWRINAVADDFGNVAADPVLLLGGTAGRRLGEVTIDRLNGWVNELVERELLGRYDVAGENYLHITGFTELQPAGKNGKRIRRVPASPWDLAGPLSADPQTVADAAVTSSESAALPGKSANSKAIRGRPGESGGIQKNPSRSSASEDEDEDDTESQKGPAAQASGPTASAAGPAASSAAGAKPADMVLEFPVDGDRSHKGGFWYLTQTLVDELATLYPSLDIVAEARAALAWVLSKPANRKTAGGMRAFLTSWLNRSQNNPSKRALAVPAGPAPATRSSVVDRTRQLLESRK
jgi:hypothetical protein